MCVHGRLCVWFEVSGTLSYGSQLVVCVLFVSRSALPCTLFRLCLGMPLFCFWCLCVLKRFSCLPCFPMCVVQSVLASTVVTCFNCSCSSVHGAPMRPCPEKNIRSSWCFNVLRSCFPCCTFCLCSFVSLSGACVCVVLLALSSHLSTIATLPVFCVCLLLRP